MTREEVEKAIKKGETVWCTIKLGEIKLNKTDYYVFDGLLQNKVLGVAYFIQTLYKTKAQAEHYLHHAHITRTESLPFLTWEEFLEKKGIEFLSKSGTPYSLCILTDIIYKKTIGITYVKDNGFMNVWSKYNLNEENFYKAYDECVRLFRGKNYTKDV